MSPLEDHARQSSFDRQPTSVAEAITHDPTFGRRSDGTLVERETVCECGRRFTQHVLSERFMRIVEGHSRRAAELLTAQVPGLWIPVHCPPCERRDLGRQARLDDQRRFDDSSHSERGAYAHAAD
ncbi:MAG TPA: hypothetical protein VN600_06855 [Gemmatimonadaceae bacterium]|nr:hypothetical protein [Gemmatimonadaceae bacterium]